MMLLEIILPYIFLLPCRRSYSFGKVTCRSATDSKNEVHVLLTSQLCSFKYLLDVGIRHNSRLFDNGLACVFQHPDNLVVNAVALDRATAIGKHNLVAVVLEFLTELVQSLFAEVKSCRI